ncbi:anti-sigma factor family protein [Amycolatopsis taiwanensis]|uniref:anti-sigma factor family protein n=1 Tax=Amycolatopsis taiwanensis TaxID=342230 RepID=UPI000482A026|nr:anti-sigma factor [Amycolatopsis taiwanensis]
MSRPDDPFKTFDAAYVLGALSPEDREAFEQHLKECAECDRAVQEMAGLPGLLSRVTPEMLDDREAPADLLPSALTRVRRARRRRALAVAGGWVTSVAAAAALVAVLMPSNASPPGTAMTPLGPYPVQAVAAVEPMPTGARVTMSCSYHGAAQGADYLLVALRADGTEAPLATWWADPDRTAKLSIGTSLSPGQIQALEIRTKNGRTVLRWNP